MEKKRLLCLVMASALTGLCLSSFVFAETIILKSGERIEGKIIERTDKYIKIDYNGVAVPLSVEEIESVEKQEKVSLEQYTARVALSAFSFRRVASAKPTQAMEQFALPGCLESWKSNIQVLFDEPELEWGDFFCYALNFIGRVEQNKAVVAFYNPWLDAVLLSEWSGSEKNLKITRFVLSSGESWRNEAVDSNNLPLVKWQQGNKPLAEAIGGVFAEFARVFDSEYPIKGEFVFLVPSLKTLAEKEKQAKEITIIKKRMELRDKKFKDFLKAKPNSDTATMGILASEVRKLIQTGNRAELELMIKGKQNQAMLDFVFRSSAKYRKKLTYNSILLKDREGIVTLVNAIFPDGFIILNMSIEGNSARLDNIEAHKFEDFRNNK